MLKKYGIKVFLGILRHLQYFNSVGKNKEAFFNLNMTTVNVTFENILFLRKYHLTFHINILEILNY